MAFQIVRFPQEKRNQKSDVAHPESTDREFPFPNQSIIDKIWLIVILSFALVLIGSFIALAIGTLNTDIANNGEPDLLLAVFTSVAGFFAGLLVNDLRHERV